MALQMDTTTSMPRGLVLIAGLLLALRVLTLVLPEHRAPDLVAWRRPTVGENKPTGVASRPILFYYSASWCEPCRSLDRQVFHDAELAAQVNAHFDSFRVIVGEEPAGDGTAEVVIVGEEPAGDGTAEVDQLLELHDIRAFPTLVIERPGQKTLRMEGYPGRARTRAFLESALSSKP